MEFAGHQGQSPSGEAVTFMSHKLPRVLPSPRQRGSFAHPERSFMKTTFKFAAAGLFAAALAHVPVFAQEATGAGASFPAPLYSKWASDFYKATGAKINYQS